MTIETGQRYRSLVPLEVTCIWDLDTVAILEDYTEFCESTLPADEELVVLRTDDSEPGLVQCTVPNYKALVPQMIPKKRRNRALGFELPAPFDVVVKKSDLLSKCRRIRTEPALPADADKPRR